MDKVCVTSVMLSLFTRFSSSTCELSSYHPYLISSGREILPHSKMDSSYHFNKLSINTSYTIRVSSTYKRDGSRLSYTIGHVNTLAPLRKFPK